MPCLKIRPRKKGGFQPWYIAHLNINGKPIKKWIKGPLAYTQKDAQREFKQWERQFSRSEFEKRVYADSKPCPTLREFSPQYLTYAIGRRLTGEGIDRAKSSLLHLNRHLGDLELKNINHHVVDQYVDLRKAEICRRTKMPYAPKSINLEVGQLSSVMQIAMRMDILDEHPFRTSKRTLSSYFLKVAKKMPTVLFPDEITKMWEATKDNAHNMSVFLFLLLSGMRKGELAGLKWEHIDLDRKQATFYCPKTDDVRTIPLSDVLIQLLKYMKINWPEPLGAKGWRPRTSNQNVYVFCDKKGAPYRREIGGFLKHLAIKAGLSKKVTPHILRHSYAAYGRTHFTLFQLQRLLGHRNISTTEKYGILLDIGMHEGANKVVEMMGLNCHNISAMLPSSIVSDFQTIPYLK